MKMITVISKHLVLFHERQPISDEDFLGAIHYIEQIRYKGNQFCSLCSCKINAPVDFSPGINVGGEELNHLYSHMIIWFELESFIRSGKSFLDHLWRLVAHNHPSMLASPDLKNQKYILQAFNILNAKDHKFKNTEIYKEINNSLSLWGRYINNFRNYIEYTEPLGGMISSVASKIELKVVNSVTTIKIILPDRFPGHAENQKSFQFNFEFRKTSNELITTIIENIDPLFPFVVAEIHKINSANY